MATSTDTGQSSGGGRSTSSGATRWVENLGETGFAYLLLAPALIILLVIAVWPLFKTLTLSFHADSIIGSGQVGGWVGLQNYQKLLSGQLNAILVRPFFDLSHPFSSSLTVTILFSVVTVAFETVIGLGQALVLNQEFRGRRWVRVAIILPWAVPVVIQAMIFFLLFQPGISFLVPFMQNLGIFTATPLQNSFDSFIIVSVADIWKTSAFMALIILAGLQSIDRQLYDVAQVAGASTWQRFRLITFPLVAQSILVAMLFRTIGAMRVYGVIQAISGCSTLPSLSCMVVTTFSSHRYGSAATIAFVTSIIIAIVVSIYLYNFGEDAI